MRNKEKMTQQKREIVSGRIEEGEAGKKQLESKREMKKTTTEKKDKL